MVLSFILVPPKKKGGVISLFMLTVLLWRGWGGGQVMDAGCGHRSRKRVCMYAMQWWWWCSNSSIFFLNWCFEHFPGLPHLPPPLPPFLSLPQTNLSIFPFLKIKSLLMEPEDWLPLGIIYCHLLVFSNETCRRFFLFSFSIYILHFFFCNHNLI